MLEKRLVEAAHDFSCFVRLHFILLYRQVCLLQHTDLSGRVNPRTRSTQTETLQPARRGAACSTQPFYAEDIHAVGIDRIIAEAGVANATFYNHFPSKDDLVLAYIEEVDRLGRQATAALPKQRPRDMAVKPVVRSCAVMAEQIEQIEPS
ncbi:TetR/AcrR family transcriptional regulator [Devosia nitrariae]|uniref:HTH tetR-type domain-containing protein n=1 Tax=Devosia nitrariae TaxID=2071872 RepID=A0ABQ5WBM8_9HYPH|nr:helix-turn-helix domain-containing protein [Devosia nitrariae]GLQ57199.1 hypothetical protein GCM10010862_44580 [Devosia nitrariae]